MTKLTHFVRERSDLGTAELPKSTDKSIQPTPPTAPPPLPTPTNLLDDFTKVEPTKCKEHGQVEDNFCLECHDLACTTCVYARHSDHTLKKPSLKMLGLRSALLEVAEQKEYTDDAELDANIKKWKEGWIEKLKNVGIQRRNQINQIASKVKVALNSVFKIYHDAASSLTEDLVDHVNYLCSKKVPKINREAMKKELESIFEITKASNYKESEEIAKSTNSFFKKYKIDHDEISLQRYLILSKLPEIQRGRRKQSDNISFENLFELLCHDPSDEKRLPLISSKYSNNGIRFIPRLDSCLIDEYFDEFNKYLCKVHEHLLFLVEKADPSFRFSQARSQPTIPELNNPV